MMKKVLPYTLKALFVLKILSWLFSDVENRFNQKDKVNFKTYDLTIWETNNCNVNIDQYLQK